MLMEPGLIAKGSWWLCEAVCLVQPSLTTGMTDGHTLTSCMLVNWGPASRWPLCQLHTISPDKLCTCARCMMPALT